MTNNLKELRFSIVIPVTLKKYLKLIEQSIGKKAKIKI